MNNIEIELEQKEFELTQCLKNKAIDPVRYDMRAYYYNSQREIILRSEIESLKKQLSELLNNKI